MIPNTATIAVRPATGPDLVARHLTERASVAPHGGRQDHEVLDRAAQDDADHDPDCARQEAELGGEGGADEGPGSGDGREMMAEQNPPVRRDIVAAVFESLGGRLAIGVQSEHALRDETTVESVRDQVRADCGDQQPSGAHRLAAAQREQRTRCRAGYRDTDPDQSPDPLRHGSRI